MAETSQSDESGDYPETPWKRNNFLQHCNLRVRDLSRNDLDWRELTAIHDDFVAHRPDLENAGQAVANQLRRLPEVHSVRARLKNPTSLIRKIVRKKEEDPGRSIGFANYRNEISDLIGLRGLHLLKEEWLSIHKLVLGHWKLAEVPVANVRKGDNQQWIDLYREHDCEIRYHDRDYRSVHYVVETAPTRDPCRVELQIRTLVEEAWAEIDHRINYPKESESPSVQECLSILNRLAGSADELGSFATALDNALRLDMKYKEDLESELEAASERIDELLGKLRLKKDEEAELRGQIGRLRDAREAPSSLFGIASTPGTPHSTAALDATIVGSTGPMWAALTPRRCLGCGEEFTDDPSLPIGLSGISYCADCRDLGSLRPFVSTTRRCAKCGNSFEPDPGSLIVEDRCQTCRMSTF